MHTILIASQSAAIRAGIHSLTGGDPEFRFLEDRRDAVLPLSSDEKAAVIIFHEDDWDWLLPLLDSPQKLILIGDQEKVIRAVKTFEAGWGVLSIQASSETLRVALLAVAEGLIVYPAQYSNLIMESGKSGDEKKPDQEKLAEPLTDRELGVLRLLAQGLQNKEVALALGISENTIKFHVSSIYSKLGASNRTEALRKGAQFGLVAL